MFKVYHSRQNGTGVPVDTRAPLQQGGTPVPSAPPSLSVVLKQIPGISFYL